MPLFGRVVGEHGKMDGRLIEAGELQPRIVRALFAFVAVERPGIGADKARAHRRAAFRGFDEDEPPGLAMTD